MKKIKVGLGTCGVSAGGELVFNKFKEELSNNHIDAELTETGCMGMCYEEALVEVEDGNDSWLYSRVTVDKVGKIVNEHLLNDRPIEKWIVRSKDINKEESFLKKQKRIVLKNCGVINPSSIEEYIARDGYKAIEKVLITLSREEVIDQIIKSGLRGRGGGGFLTGMKWKFAYSEKADKKYIICNADEGDPGAFMDRSVLEGDPHSVLEGMMIAAYAMGSDEGFIYARAEYPLAVKRLRKALAQCRNNGLLGKNILGTNFNFNITIKEGAGAFVCGEETALMKSIEGKRGVPQLRPPFPTHKGLWGKPTSINNVETFANVPWIILNGWEKFAAMGTEKSKGSKVFALAGKINRTGLVEVPMGITINEIVYEVGGGIKGQ